MKIKKCPECGSKKLITKIKEVYCGECGFIVKEDIML